MDVTLLPSDSSFMDVLPENQLPTRGQRMVTDVKPLQNSKAPSPIDVTLLPMFTVVRPLQPLKAPSPIDVTLSGMVTDVKPRHPEKAEALIVVTLLGIFVFEHPFIKVLVAVSIMALQLSRESYLELSLLTLIEVKPLQPQYLLLVDYQYFTP